MAERAERREKRRLIDARFPQIKRLEDFRFADNPKVPQATIAALAEGSWIDDRESVIFIGDSGTGKTMLATALAVCACHQGRRVRFTTLAALANELQEAQGNRELARVVGRYARTELLVCDELGYLALARRCRRARLPGPLRAPRTRQPDRHHQPAVRRVDQGVPRPAARESRRRPAHPPSAHHRHRQRVLALPPRPRTPSDARKHDPPPGAAPAAIAARHSPYGLGPRDDSRGMPSNRAIRQHQHQQQPTRRWGHFKPSRRGQCKPSFLLMRPKRRAPFGLVSRLCTCFKPTTEPRRTAPGCHQGSGHRRWSRSCVSRTALQAHSLRAPAAPSQRLRGRPRSGVAG